MPKSSKSETQPADAIDKVVRVKQIAIGENDAGYEGKDKAAQEMGRKGGAARAKAMTPEQRVEVAKKAAAKRWGH